MIILGVDPGSRLTGYGVVRKTSGNSTEHVENGTLYLKDHEVFADRLVHLHKSLKEVIARYGVQALAVENIFYHKNPKSIQKLGEVRGVIILSGALAGLPVFEYTALQVKQAVTGYGKASKDQMQSMVRKLLKLPDLAEENASDALGIALCHAHQSGRSLGALAGQYKSSAVNARQEILKKASFYR